MRVINVKKDQSLLDIALQEYGHVEGVFLLVEDNFSLIGITDSLHQGDELRVRKTKINAPMQSFLKEYELATAKGAMGEGIGYWIVSKDFKVS